MSNGRSTTARDSFWTSARSWPDNNIYFTSLVETAAWGAEPAIALAGLEERGHVYVVEPWARSRTTRT